MDRLTTNQPNTNFLTLMNFAFCGDDGATVLRFAGKPIVSLGDYMSEQCQKRGCDCDKISAEALDGFMGCPDCPLGILYYCAVQGAELRYRLMQYEDTGLSLDEILALKAENKRLHELVDIIENTIKAL